MATYAFRSLTKAEEIYKTLIWDTSKDALIYAAENYPYTAFLKVPPLKQIFEWVVNTVSDYLYKSWVLFVDTAAIRLVNAEHQSAYDKASLQLKIVDQEKGTASDDYKTALAAAQAAMSKFTRFGAT